MIFVILGTLLGVSLINGILSGATGSATTAFPPQLLAGAISIIILVLLLLWISNSIFKHKTRNDPGMATLNRIAQRDAEAGEQPPFIVRLYEGRETEAFTAFRLDANHLAAYGYAPTSQDWIPGEWGAGQFLLGLCLCVFLIGFIVIIYMLIIKPKGKLSVTFTHSAPVPP